MPRSDAPKAQPEPRSSGLRAVQRWLPLSFAVAALLAACGNVSGGSSPAPNRVGAPTGRASTPTATMSPGQASAARCGATAAQQALSQSGTLTGVQFVSASRGWVVGARQILATTDGGHSWAVQQTGNLGLASADFIGNDTGWAVGADTLLTTSDGGQRWTALPEPCPVIRSVHFASATVGFAIAGGAPLEPGSLAPTSGGQLLASTDGGRSWTRLPAPANPQSVCFANSQDGWLGAGGALYRSTDGGAAWTQVGAGPGRSDAGYPFTMIVQCAGASSAWATDIGTGVASSQQPHLGYHAGPAGVSAIFAEQYFPHPGIAVTARSPGPYAGAMSAISPTTAVYVDNCPACGYGTAPWDLATAAGATLAAAGNVGYLTEATAASFLGPSTGWVVGEFTNYSNPSKPRSYQRVVYTDDGGRNWQVQYSAS